MVFWILVVFLCMLAFVPILVAVAGGVEGFFTGIGVALAVGFIPGIIVTTVWTSHAKDLGTIYAQHEVISVYQERVNRLTERLDGFDYPRQDAALLLNADSPVRSIVESLTEAEAQLAEAESYRAEAIRSIERRRRGPMSGVISLVGDYQ